MRMVMVVVAGRRHIARTIGADWRIIMGMAITVFVAVVPKMCSVVARRVLQRIANAHYCRIGGVQREHECKNKREASAHGREAYPNVNLANRNFFQKASIH